MIRHTFCTLLLMFAIASVMPDATSYAQGGGQGAGQGAGMGRAAGATSATAGRRGARAGAGRQGRGRAVDTPTTVALATLAPPRHQGFLDIAKQGNIDIVFFGDSITDFWRNTGKTVWDKTWAPLKAANFGISAEKVEHVLWRVENGELDGYKPKLIVLMIGTNNLGERTITNGNIVEGIQHLTAVMHQKQPDAKLLVLGIFPRSAQATNPLRARIKAINTELAKMDDGKKTFYLDFGEKFLTADGTLTTEIMPDGLHPSAKGYQIWADAMMPKAKQLVGSK